MNYAAAVSPAAWPDPASSSPPGSGVRGTEADGPGDAAMGYPGPSVPRPLRRPKRPAWAAITEGTGPGRVRHLSLPIDVPAAGWLWIARTDRRLHGGPGWREGPVVLVWETGQSIELDAALILADRLAGHAAALEGLVEVARRGD